MTLTSEIESGKYYLIDYGEILPADINDSPVINFTFDNGQKPFKFTLRVEYSSTEESKPQYKVDIDKNTNTITLFLNNFTNVIGSGNIDLLNIATLGGKKCFLRFFSSKVATEIGNLFRYYVFMEK